MRGAARAALALTGLVLLGGCDGPDLFSKAPGNYSGFSTTGEVARLTQRAAVVTISATSKRELAVVVAEADTTRRLVVRAESDNQLTLDGYRLKKATSECFEAEGQKPQARLCFNGIELTLELPAYAVMAQRVSGHTPPTLEKPKAFSLDEILKRAANQSFDTRVGFERVLQSRLTAQNSFLNLLPHVSFGTVFSLATSFNLLSAARAIGDLVPFLIPTRWFQAFEVQHQSKADAFAFVLMRADAVNVVEGLSYSLLRDQAIVDIYERHRLAIADLRDEMRDRERMGLLRQGVSDDISSIVTVLAKAVLALTDVVRQERAGLAQASGFFNPDAIESVALATGPMDEISELPPDEELRRLAFERSYELMQMDELIVAAKLNRVERYIGWLDPSPPRDGALGFGLIPYVQIGQSQVRELEARREGTESKLLEKITAGLSGYRQSIDSQKLAVENVALQEKRVTRLKEWLALGISFPVADLVNALQDQVKADIDLVTTEFAYAIMRAKLNRALFAGSYAGLTFKEKR